jgi:hypothetical protein
MDGSQEVACLSAISSRLSQASKIGRTAQHPAKRILCLRLVQRLAIACRGVVELPIPFEEPTADTKQLRSTPRLACLQTVRERLVDCCEPFDKFGLGKSFAERTQKSPHGDVKALKPSGGVWYVCASACAFLRRAAFSSLLRSGGGAVRLTTGSPTAMKNCSWPVGVHIRSMR